MALSRMHNEKYAMCNIILNLVAELRKFYRNSSVIVDLAVGQIPRSTEHISSIVNSSDQLKFHF